MGKPDIIDVRVKIGDWYPADIVWADRTLKLEAIEKAIYWKLCRFAGNSGEVFVKDVTLGAELGVSEHTIRRHRAFLGKAGLILWARAKHRRCSVYTFLWHEIFTGQHVDGQPGCDQTPNVDSTGQHVDGQPDLTGQPSGHAWPVATGQHVSVATGQHVDGVKNQSEPDMNQTLSLPDPSQSDTEKRKRLVGWLSPEEQALFTRQDLAELERLEDDYDGHDLYVCWVVNGKHDPNNTGIDVYPPPPVAQLAA